MGKHDWDDEKTEKLYFFLKYGFLVLSLAFLVVTIVVAIGKIMGSIG